MHTTNPISYWEQTLQLGEHAYWIIINVTLWKKTKRKNRLDQFSQSTFIQYGVPHGTILGPTLWLLYYDLLFVDIKGKILYKKCITFSLNSLLKPTDCATNSI